MSVRPIIFSGPMVVALLAARKTQTRRLASSPLAKCRPGDLLYVRESFGIKSWDEDGYFWLEYKADGAVSGLLHPGDDDALFERLTDRLDAMACPVGEDGNYVITERHRSVLSRPSIHMPRWASRLTLEVTEVRQEPLQAIGSNDAISEGMASISKDGLIVKYGLPDRDGLPGDDDHGWPWDQWQMTPRRAFEKLWRSLHGHESWEQSPEVVVLTFRVFHQNVDELLVQREVA